MTDWEVRKKIYVAHTSKKYGEETVTKYSMNQCNLPSLDFVLINAFYF